MRHKYIVVEGKILGSSRASSHAICAKHQNGKIKNAGAEEPAMFYSIHLQNAIVLSAFPGESQPAPAGGTNIATPLLLWAS